MSAYTASGSAPAEQEHVAFSHNGSIGDLVYTDEPAVDLELIDFTANVGTLPVQAGSPSATRASDRPLPSASGGATSSFGAFSAVPGWVTPVQTQGIRVSLGKQRIPESTAAAVRRIVKASMAPQAIHDPEDRATVSLRHAVDALRFVVRFVGDRVPPPSVVPLSDGGVQLEWHRNGVDLEVTFTDEADDGVYCREVETGSRWSLPLDVAALEHVPAVVDQLIGDRAPG